jgi:hypothetical protein
VILNLVSPRFLLFRTRKKLNGEVDSAMELWIRMYGIICQNLYIETSLVFYFVIPPSVSQIVVYSKVSLRLLERFDKLVLVASSK